MPSEKSRYLNRRLPSPLDFDKLQMHLISFEREHLANLLWMSAQTNCVLQKALVASISLRLANGEFEKAKSAIDYALDFPDYIRYYERGYGIIVNEIHTTLKYLYQRNDKAFVLRVSKYVLDLGKTVAECFEDDWDWISSLEDFEDWLKTINTNG